MTENEPVKRKRGRPPSPRPPPRQLAEADYAVERWKPWPRDPRVHVSDMGRVKSKTGRVLKPQSGKWEVEVGMGVRVKVKLLVWQTWVADVDNIAITHTDGDRTNCAVTNLAAYERLAFIKHQAASLTRLTRAQAAKCVDMYRAGRSCREIGLAFGVSDMAVHNAIKRLGLTAKEIRRKRKEREDERAKELAEECLSLWREGMTWTQVAHRLGVSPGCVNQRMLRAGMSPALMSAERKGARHAEWASVLGIPISQVANKEANLRQEYDLSVPEYIAMKQSQGNRCALCSRVLGPERTAENMADVGKSWPVVDHCHRTDGKGSVRSVLHAGCNALIGFADEDPEVMRMGARYIERTRHARPFRPAPHTPGLPGLQH